MRRFRMPAELHLLRLRQLQVVLEPLANLLQPLLARILVLARLSGRRALLRRLTRSARPETHTPEGFADVNHHTHDLILALVFQRLADGSEHDVQPGGVGGFASLEGVGPAAAVLILWVFPLWAHAGLEEVVVGLLGELGGGGDIVLGAAQSV